DAPGREARFRRCVQNLVPISQCLPFVQSIPQCDVLERIFIGKMHKHIAITQKLDQINLTECDRV
ncbi:MAG: hypothetical protein VX228_07910, partial [Pseudomonadota bacterium]|nr:hypothetical protein [Pseudomonadota bacterium]